jgi:hypothetical protein
MSAQQLELFLYEPTEYERVLAEVRANYVRFEGARKGLYQRNTQMSKEVTQMRSEMDELKGQIQVLMRIFQK